MAAFRIYRMKELAAQQFRWAPHLAGGATVKRKDYEESGSLESANEYSAWKELKESEQPLRVGDLLETESGQLRICKYVGFDEATWLAPEVKTGLEGIPPASGPAESASAS